VFLVVAFSLHSNQHSLVFPGNRELTMDYLTQRPVELEEPKEEEPQAGLEAATEVEPASTAGDEGLKGGEGDRERQRAPDPDKGATDKKIVKGLLTDKSRDAMKRAVQGGFDKKLGNALARMRGPAMDGSLGGFGKGSGTGVDLGAGTGTLTKGGTGGSGGGGTAHADFVSQGAIKTGGKGAPRGVSGGKGVAAVAVKVTTGTASGDLGGLTHAQILKVVKSRRRAIQACYERQLQRVQGLSGKIVVRWKINASGAVTTAKVASTSMRNGGVEDCIVRQVRGMKFPSPKNGTLAVVNFPFLFAPR
jgi:TonB family protein